MTDSKLLSVLEDVIGVPMKFVSIDDVKKLLRRNKKIRNNPGRVSGYVNDRLDERFDDASYPASPNNVHGLIGILTDAFNDIELYDSGFVDRGTEVYEVYELFQKSMFFSFMDHDYFGLSDSPVQVSVDCLYPFFNSANNEKINIDSEFKKLCIQDLKEEFEILKIDRDNYLSRFFCGFIEKLETIDFETRFSKKEYDKEIVREIRKNEITSFRPFKIYQNVVNSDEEMSDYQRPLLCLWLDELNLIKNIRNYESAVNFNSANLEFRKRKLQETDGRWYLESYVKTQKELIDFAEFIGKTLESDRDFVKRYLKN